MKFLKSREVQIGIMLFLIISLSVWGFNFLKGKNILGATSYYYCTFEDVGGLMESNFVMVQGFKVGLVEDIELKQGEDGRKIVVRIILEDDLQVPIDSKAELYSQDLLGTKAVKLVLGKSNTFFKVGDELPSSIEEGMLDGIKKEAGPMVDNLEVIMLRIDSIMQGVQKTFSEENIIHIQNTIANLEHTSSRVNRLLKEKEASIGTIISSLDSIAAAVAGEKASIAATLKNVESITDSLSQVELAVLMENVAQSVENLNGVLSKVNNSEGTLGLLVNDSALYENLNGASKSLDNLLIDLKRKPARYAHLSLIDWGKDVYIDDEGDAIKVNDKMQLKFGVLLKMSEKQLALNELNFYDPKLVNERKYKGTYYYFYGVYPDYHDAKEDLSSYVGNYPNAELIGLDEKKIYFFE